MFIALCVELALPRRHFFAHHMLFLPAIMVFHGKRPTGSKKTKIGRLAQPRRRTDRDEAPEEHQEAAEHPEPAVPEADPPPPRPKKQRPDDNWRVARAVRSRDRRQTLARSHCSLDL